MHWQRSFAWGFAAAYNLRFFETDFTFGGGFTFEKDRAGRLKIPACPCVLTTSSPHNFVLRWTQGLRDLGIARSLIRQRSSASSANASWALGQGRRTPQRGAAFGRAGDWASSFFRSAGNARADRYTISRTLTSWTFSLLGLRP